MKQTLFLTGFLLTMLLTACGGFKNVTMGGIQNAHITKLDTKELQAEVTIRIKNPNNYGFKIYPSDLDVMLNNSPIGAARIDKKVKIKRNSDEEHTFIIKSDLSKLGFESIPALMGMFSKNNLNVGIKGDIKAGRMFYKYHIPVDVKDKVNLNNQGATPNEGSNNRGKRKTNTTNCPAYKN